MSKDREFIETFLKQAPRGLGDFDDADDAHIDREQFPPLRFAEAHREWLANAVEQLSRELEEYWAVSNGGGSERSGGPGDQALIDHARAEHQRLSPVERECLRAPSKAIGRVRELQWLCKAEIELTYARRVAADPETPDPEKAREWLKLCERYMQIVYECWEAERERRAKEWP